MNLSVIILLLAFLIDIEGAIAHDKVSLAYMVPDSWILTLKAWDAFLLYCGTNLIALLAAPDAFRRRAIGAVVAVFVALLFLGAPDAARAADAASATTPTVAAKTPTPATQNNCIINSCTGWYAGVGLSGNGTNADIIGSGINQSIFAAGGMLDLHGGYQFWNGTYFAAAEVGIGYQFENGAIKVGTSNLTGYEIVKFGAALSGLFNTSNSSGSGPIAIPSALSSALISPYLAMGAIQRNGVSQWATGAGAAFLLATNWDLDIRYLYAPAVSNVGADNLVTIGLNKHF